MSQSAFATALLDPSLAVPEGLTDPQGRPAGRRFDVYRNTVVHSLTEALRIGFPVLRKLLGDEYFTALAGVFVRENPPVSPLLMFYGAQMPGFLAQFPPLAHLPYMADVARLELALRESYHAADADPVPPAQLATLTPDALLAARLKLAPALRLIVSDHPVWSIWASNALADAPPVRPGAQAVLILRPGFDPAPHLLLPGAAAFIAALLASHRVAEALEAAGNGFDLTSTLTLLLQGNALIQIEED